MNIYFTRIKLESYKTGNSRIINMSFGKGLFKTKDLISVHLENTLCLMLDQKIVIDLARDEHFKVSPSIAELNFGFYQKNLSTFSLEDQKKIIKHQLTF